jgi:hypothetical protein
MSADKKPEKTNFNTPALASFLLNIFGETDSKRLMQAFPELMKARDKTVSVANKTVRASTVPEVGLITVSVNP